MQNTFCENTRVFLKLKYCTCIWPNRNSPYIDLSYPGQPYSESGTGEVLKGQVQPLLVELEVGLQGLLDRRPHQLRHVTVSRHSQVFVRQFTHVSKQKINKK